MIVCVPEHFFSVYQFPAIDFATYINFKPFTKTNRTPLNQAIRNTLLIVDDDEIVVVLMKNLFEKKYNVFTASDGIEALSHLSQGVIPDLIISDLMMKNVTGYEFIRLLFTNTDYKKIPVIVVSSSPVAELSQEFPSIQFMDKPFDPALLQNLVDASQVTN